jgi:non-specific serine/threonine protein kinase
MRLPCFTICMGLNNLAATFIAEGDDATAAGMFEQSLGLQRDAGNPAMTAFALGMLGTLALGQNDYTRVTEMASEAVDLLRKSRVPWYVPEGLELLAAAAGVQGQSGRAARLFGAAGAVRLVTGAAPDPIERAQADRAIAAARAALGEAEFQAAREEGRTLPLERVISFALAETALTVGPASAEASQPPLTPREREVAALVARGLTNRQIAAELVITEGTVGVHVVHILDKLGFRSRAQVAAWAAERGLGGAAQP